MASVSSLFLLLLLSPSTPDVAPSDEVILQQAATAFREGLRARGSPGGGNLFKEAAAGLEELRRRGASNPALFRDEGNAYVLAGDLSHAILAYRRGLRLAPGDSGLRAGLAYARDQVLFASTGGFGKPAGDSWPPWLLRWSPQVGWVAFLLCYSVGWVGLTRWYMTRDSWLLGLAAGGFALAVALGTWMAVEEAIRRDEGRHPLVVIAADDVYLRKGNGFAYPPRYETPLNRGVEARLRFVRGAWLQIELAGGEIGWVPRNAVLIDQ